jgi:hypothetical protein
MGAFWNVRRRITLLFLVALVFITFAAVGSGFWIHWSFFTFSIFTYVFASVFCDVHALERCCSFC